jgi:hypothetical protein
MESLKDMTTTEKLEVESKAEMKAELTPESKPEIKTKPKNSELNELKNIKYKTSAKSETTETADNLDLFLENEKINNQGESWIKLDKPTKYRKMADFVEKYSSDKNLTEEEKTELGIFLKDAVDKKKLYKVKDIVYDKVHNFIKDIPGLVFLKSDHKNFTLRNTTKMTTLKSMPKKKILI